MRAPRFGALDLGRHELAMKIPERTQYLLIALLAVVAIAFAVPAMHDYPIERFLRGECTWRGHSHCD